MWNSVFGTRFLGLFFVVLFQFDIQAQVSPFIHSIWQPSHQEVKMYCNSDDVENLQKCEAFKMISAYSIGDFLEMHKAFGRFISSMSTEPIDAYQSSVIYRYANYLEVTGEKTSALKYYNFLSNRSAKTCIGLYEVLGRLGSMGLENNEEVIARYTEKLEEEMSCLSHNDKAIVLLKLVNYLDENEAYTLIKKFTYLLDRINDSGLKCKFLSDLYYRLQFKNDAEAENIFTDYTKCFEVLIEPRDSFIIIPPLKNKALKDGDYTAALHMAQRLVELQYGKFTTVNELLDKYKKSNLHSFRSITEYAQTKLFQTRLGLGVKPVQEAYFLYNGIYEFDLSRRLEKIRKFSSSGVGQATPNFQNLLIVGNYLYGKTGEERYLAESISILDGYAGAGTYFWVLARERMRKDPAFAAALTALLEQEAALSAAPEDQPLAELFAQDQQFRHQRQAFREDYADFYEALHTSYQLDLPDLREALGRDSSAAVCFYATELILYRFFISQDTTELTILDRDLEEVRTLTRQLKTTAGAPRQDQAALAERSHRLYGLLFQGLDSLLTPGLHIVASDELIDIPFAGLRISAQEEEPRYLGTEHALSRQFSLGSMMILATQQRTPRYAVPLALAPTFAGELLTASALREAGFALSPLLYNQEEVRNIQNHGQGAYYFGKDATLEAFQRNAPDYGILHFASHAISSQLDGVRSRVFLLDGDGDPQPLFASDLAKTTLNAELVVLSACETGGGGRNTVEGRVGLTKAFLGAGARAVVASSWAVDDYATADIMDAFYAAVAKGIAPHEALRQARISYLTAHPGAPLANWAAFEAYGGMVAPAWELQGQHNWWLWGGGMAALFGLGLGTAALRRAA